MPPLDTLARTCWGEARGDGRSGMTAVACVVMNRVKVPCWWGHDVVSVCVQPRQFSCWDQGDPNRAKLLAVNETDPEYAIALEIAASALAGTLVDTTNGATSYKTTVLPWPTGWGSPRNPVAVVGHQSFYCLE